MTPNPVSQHYTRPALAQAVLAGLAALGKDPTALAPADLHTFDQFHIGGRDATLALLALAGLAPGQRVLDLGGGLGGPARTLAQEAGVRVTVLDLTESFCRLGADLTRRTGLAGQVGFGVGDATRLPFAGASFDTVWSQHSSMNVPDKAALYAEAWRVLRPGGRLAFHEIMAGPRQPVHFPVPWASEPGHSALAAPAETRALLAGLGFRERAWHDLTADSRDWWRARRAAAGGQAAPHPLGLHLVMGPATKDMVANLMRNLDEERVAVVQAVLERLPQP